jgi:hypothetical protein
VRRRWCARNQPDLERGPQAVGHGRCPGQAEVSCGRARYGTGLSDHGGGAGLWDRGGGTGLRDRGGGAGLRDRGGEAGLRDRGGEAGLRDRGGEAGCGPLWRGRLQGSGSCTILRPRADLASPRTPGPVQDCKVRGAKSIWQTCPRSGVDDRARSPLNEDDRRGRGRIAGGCQVGCGTLRPRAAGRRGWRHAGVEVCLSAANLSSSAVTVCRKVPRSWAGAGLNGQRCSAGTCGGRSRGATPVGSARSASDRR